MIETASRRNARLALLIFIPGADMPVLTAVQMQMVLRIAACHGEDVGKDRAVELLSVLGAGFGFRQIARSMLDFVPIAGWVIQAGDRLRRHRGDGQGRGRVLRAGHRGRHLPRARADRRCAGRSARRARAVREDGIGGVRERFRSLVEALAAGVALGALAVVLRPRRTRVVAERAEDLAGARQLRALDVALGVPEVGADQRLRALRVGLLDRDEDPEPRDGSPSTSLGASSSGSSVIDAAAVDAERVADAGDQEEQPDRRVARAGS